MKKSTIKSFLVAILLLFSYCSVFAGSEDDLVKACMAGDIAGVNKALESGADVNKADANGTYAIAAAYFWPEITKLLIEKGADVNKGDYPALISAANNYSIEVVKLLLDAGADPNKPGVTDPAATFRTLIAAENAKGKNANKALIKAWENAMGNMKPGQVNLMQVVVQQTNCVPCLKMLIDKGAKVDMVDPTTNTNLIHTLAAMGMTKEERKTQFSKGAEGMAAFGVKVPEWYTNLPDDRNGTSEEMLKLLIQKGLDLNLVATTGYNTLLTALVAGKLGVAKALVEAGVDVTFLTPKTKKDAVCLTAEHGDLELLKALVAKGATVTNETWDLDEATGTYCKGFTALSRAVIYNHYDCAKYLIEAGCQVKEGIVGFFSKRMYNRKGIPMRNPTTGGPLVCRYKMKNKTPIYFAIENENLEMVKLLATSFKWYANHTMEMEPKCGDKAVQAACSIYGGGSFSPSKYAKSLGYTEIQDYLKSLGK